MYPNSENAYKLVYNLWFMGVTGLAGVYVHPVLGFLVVMGWAGLFMWDLYWRPLKHPETEVPDEVSMQRHFDTWVQQQSTTLQRDVDALKAQMADLRSKVVLRE